MKKEDNSYKSLTDMYIKKAATDKTKYIPKLDKHNSIHERYEEQLCAENDVFNVLKDNKI
jgi:hypothetical protein